MFNVNRVTLLGTVTRDAEQGTQINGDPKTTIGLATETEIKMVQGRKESIVEFHRVVCFDDLSEFAGKLKKGTPLYIEGRLHMNLVRNKDGDDRSVMEVIADKIVVLSKKGKTDSELD